MRSKHNGFPIFFPIISHNFLYFPSVQGDSTMGSSYFPLIPLGEKKVQLILTHLPYFSLFEKNSQWIPYLLHYSPTARGNIIVDSPSSSPSPFFPWENTIDPSSPQITCCSRGVTMDSLTPPPTSPLTEEKEQWIFSLLPSIRGYKMIGYPSFNLSPFSRRKHN